MNIVQDLPDKIPFDDKWCFFLIVRKTWKNGKPQRIRMPFKKAKAIAYLADTEIFWDQDQAMPKGAPEIRPPGSQAALVYGVKMPSKKGSREILGY